MPLQGRWSSETLAGRFAHSLPRPAPDASHSSFSLEKITKIFPETIVSGNYFVIISAGMVCAKALGRRLEGAWEAEARTFAENNPLCVCPDTQTHRHTHTHTHTQRHIRVRSVLRWHASCGILTETHYLGRQSRYKHD